ncbi:hypothetical protein KIN20_035832 [Parelaphostrongylus tenuis]|uniref:Uncharacterized protein n=1 Tax=Parelaphostrongylus tenuis TaxID=148309 RepID=A0AAD5RBS1_PARTN|nr:hypothetical protein KIN20_035832 [Parelaphostrongylus tenuis]
MDKKEKKLRQKKSEGKGKTPTTPTEKRRSATFSDTVLYDITVTDLRRSSSAPITFIDFLL